MFAILATLDFAIAWILNAAGVVTPRMFDNWGMLFLGLVFVGLHLWTGFAVPVMRRRAARA